MTTSNAVLITKAELEKPVASENNVGQLLEQYRRSFEVAAPQHLDVNRVMRVALMTVSRSQDLLECTLASLLGAFMLSVQMGLDIGAKECHLVPFKNSKAGGRREVQLVPDYRGVLKLIRNSEKVCGVRARNVYKQDLFELEEGTQPVMRHIPNFDHPRKYEDIVGAYSIADFCNAQGMPTGYSDAHYIPRVHINKVRDKSPASKQGPWVDHFDEMALKTVMKHHSKTLPYSIALITAVELDNRVEMTRPQNISLLENPATGLLTAEAPVGGMDEQSGAGSSTNEGQGEQSGPVISEPQAKRAYAIATKSHGFSTEQYHAAVKKAGYDSDRDIPKSKYDAFVAEIEKGPQA